MADSLPPGFVPVPVTKKESTAPVSNVPSGFVAAPIIPEQAKTTTETTISEPTSTYLSRLKERLQRRGEEVSQTLYDISKEQPKRVAYYDVFGQPQYERPLSYTDAAIQLFGKGVAGSAQDLIGETVATGFGKATDFGAVLIPDFIKEPIKQELSNGFNYVASTPAAQEALLWAKDGIEAWQGYKERNPQSAKTIESIVDIAAFYTPAKNRSPIADMIERSAQRARKPFVADLVAVPDSFKNNVEAVSRAETNIFGSRRVIPTQKETDIVDAVSKLGVSSSKNLQENYNIIKEANQKLAMQLEQELASSGVQVPTTNLLRDLTQNVNALKQNMAYLVGENAQVADRALTKAMDLFSNTNGSAAGLLSARKEFDKWVLQQRGKTAFASEKSNAINDTVRVVRSTLNETLANAVPTVAVKDSLRTQHLYYSAMENIAPKAAKESATAIGRLWQNVHRVTGISFPTTPLAIGALGYGTTNLLTASWMPYVALPILSTAGVYSVYKNAMHPRTRQGIANLIRAASGAIDATNNPAMRTQLRTDRAMMMELLKQIPADKEAEIEVDGQTPADARLPDMLKALSK